MGASRELGRPPPPCTAMALLSPPHPPLSPVSQHGGGFPTGCPKHGMCQSPSQVERDWVGGWDTAGSRGGPVGLLAGFKFRFLPRLGWGGDRGWVTLRVGGWHGRGVRGGAGGGGAKDSTYWLVMEAWVAGWGKLVVQTV